jgi:lysophospholipase L1-like esterase
MLHAFVVLILVKSDFISRAKIKIGLESLKPEFTEFYNEMIAYHGRMDNNIPENAIIFLGDSLIQSLSVSAIAPLTVNYGIGNDTSLGVINRLKHYRSIGRAKIVIIAIGLNDLSRRKPVGIMNNYEIIINSIPHNVHIIFNALHPVNEIFCKDKKRTNVIINQLNYDLKKLCSKYENVHFISIADFLIDKTGNLSDEYHTGDGVHLNQNGYGIWIRELKLKIDELNKEID